jgi:hypothetical protein
MSLIPLEILDKLPFIIGSNFSLILLCITKFYSHFSGKMGNMSKKILLVLLSLSIATPAVAGGRGEYNNGNNSGYGGHYNSDRGRSDYRDHGRRGHSNGKALALIGGVILGVAIAKSAERNTRKVYYAEPTYAPRCYNQEVTERTLSGRLVTYIETLCD